MAWNPYRHLNPIFSVTTTSITITIITKQLIIPTPSFPPPVLKRGQGEWKPDFGIWAPITPATPPFSNTKTLILRLLMCWYWFWHTRFQVFGVEYFSSSMNIFGAPKMDHILILIVGQGHHIVYLDDGIYPTTLLVIFSAKESKDTTTNTTTIYPPQWPFHHSNTMPTIWRVSHSAHTVHFSDHGLFFTPRTTAPKAPSYPQPPVITHSNSPPLATS